MDKRELKRKKVGDCRECVFKRVKNGEKLMFYQVEETDRSRPGSMVFLGSTRGNQKDLPRVIFFLEKLKDQFGISKFKDQFYFCGEEHNQKIFLSANQLKKYWCYLEITELLQNFN
jgi:hypothetical protein